MRIVLKMADGIWPLMMIDECDEAMIESIDKETGEKLYYMKGKEYEHGQAFENCDIGDFDEDGGADPA